MYVFLYAFRYVLISVVRYFVLYFCILHLFS